MAAKGRYSQEVRERAVRMVFEQWAGTSHAGEAVRSSGALPPAGRTGVVAKARRCDTHGSGRHCGCGLIDLRGPVVRDGRCDPGGSGLEVGRRLAGPFGVVANVAARRRGRDHVATIASTCRCTLHRVVDRSRGGAVGPSPMQSNAAICSLLQATRRK